MKKNVKEVKNNTVREKIKAMVSNFRLTVTFFKLGISFLGLLNTEIPRQVPAIYSKRVNCTFRKREYKETKIKATIGSFNLDFHNKKTVEY